MTPEKGQQVKCILRSSLIVEGIVQEWSDTQVVLKALDDSKHNHFASTGRGYNAD